jgi:hypothetical protein
VLAAAKRARQLVDGNKTYVEGDVRKPLSVAVAELNSGMVKILPEGVVCEECESEAAEGADAVCEKEETAEAEENTEDAATEAIVVQSEEVQL